MLVTLRGSHDSIFSPVFISNPGPHGRRRVVDGIGQHFGRQRHGDQSLLFLSRGKEFPVQVSWGAHEEIIPQTVCSETLGHDIFHSETFESSRERGE